MENNITVVVVEDEPQLRQLLAMVLRTRFRYQVTAFATADEALGHILETNPRLVMSDTEMPGKMNGIALLIEVKKALPGILFVNMSGRPEFEDQAEENGSDGFVRKPYELSDLEELFKKLDLS